MSSKQSISIIQLTDPHLFDNADRKLGGMNTRQSFDAVISHIYRQKEPVDLILVTGDVSQDLSEGSYRYLYQQLSLQNSPCYWIPGNHDEQALMMEYFAQSPFYADKNVHIGNWQIVLLDSCKKGQVYGEFSRDELSFLDNALAASTAEHAVVVMHHQVLAVGSQWLDNIGCRNTEQLLNIIDRHPRVRLLLHGHVHQAFHGKHKAVDIYATPSTCIQFKPLQSEFGLDELAPGYRQITLNGDGTHQTAVVRLKDFDIEIDKTTKGY